MSDTTSAAHDELIGAITRMGWKQTGLRVGATFWGKGEVRIMVPEFTNYDDYQDLLWLARRKVAETEAPERFDPTIQSNLFWAEYWGSHEIIEKGDK